MSAAAQLDRLSAAPRAEDLLGLDAASIDALVEHALRQAEHGDLEGGSRLMRALAELEPERPVLALLVGHLEVERGALEAALVDYAEAARRLAALGLEASELAADVDLARAEVELRLGLPAPARVRLDRAVASGSAQGRARAEALLRGLEATR